MTLKTWVFRALIHRESWIPLWKLSENSEVRFKEHRPSFERIVEEETREQMIEIEDPSIHRRKFFNDRTFQLSFSLLLAILHAHTRPRKICFAISLRFFRSKFKPRRGSKSRSDEIDNFSRAQRYTNFFTAAGVVRLN